MVFLTKYGQRWAKDSIVNPISKEFAKILQPLKVNAGRSKSRSIARAWGSTRFDTPFKP